MTVSWSLAVKMYRSPSDFKNSDEVCGYLMHLWRKASENGNPEDEFAIECFPYDDYEAYARSDMMAWIEEQVTRWAERNCQLDDQLIEKGSRLPA